MRSLVRLQKVKIGESRHDVCCWDKMKESKQENLGGDGSRQTLLCSSIGNTIYLDASKVILLNQENRSISKQVNPEVVLQIIVYYFVFNSLNFLCIKP